MTQIRFNSKHGYSIQDPPISVIDNLGNITCTAVTSGAWQATPIADLYISSSSNWNTAYTDRMKWDGGSTGLTASTGRSSLGLVIGTDVQAYSAVLTSAAGGSYSGNAATVTNGAYINASNNFSPMQNMFGGITIGDATSNETILSQDIMADELLRISSYSSIDTAQFLWLKSYLGKIITVGDIENVSYPLLTTWDCDNGVITNAVDGASVVIDSTQVLTIVGDSSITVDSGSVSLCGSLVVDSGTGNISASLNSISAQSLTASSGISGATITTGSVGVIQGTATATTTSTTQATLLSLSSTTYSSVKYFVQARNTTTSRFQITEIVATRNGTTTVVTATPVDTNSGGIACTYAVDISSSNFRLRITPQAASSTVFKVHYTAMP